MRIIFKKQIPGRPDGAAYSSDIAHGVDVGGEFEATPAALDRLNRDFPGCFEDASQKPAQRQDRQARPRTRGNK